MILLFVVIGLALCGLAYLAYRESLRRHEERVIARYEETQRDQERRRKAAMGLIPNAPGAAPGQPAEIEGVPVEVFEAECADVLAQLAQRRRDQRRPARRPTTRRAAAVK